MTYISALSFLKKLKNFLHRKINYEGFWRTEILKYTKFKIGDYIIVVSENYRTGNKVENQYQILDIEVSRKANNIIYSQLNEASYIFQNNKGIIESCNVSSIDADGRLDTETTSKVGFNADLKDLLK